MIKINISTLLRRIFKKKPSDKVFGIKPVIGYINTTPGSYDYPYLGNYMKNNFSFIIENKIVEYLPYKMFGYIIEEIRSNHETFYLFESFDKKQVVIRKHAIVRTDNQINPYNIFNSESILDIFIELEDYGNLIRVSKFSNYWSIDILFKNKPDDKTGWKDLKHLEKSISLINKSIDRISNVYGYKTIVDLGNGQINIKVNDK